MHFFPPASTSLFKLSYRMDLFVFSFLHIIQRNHCKSRNHPCLCLDSWIFPEFAVLKTKFGTNSQRTRNLRKLFYLLIEYQSTWMLEQLLGIYPLLLMKEFISSLVNCYLLSFQESTEQFHSETFLIRIFH